jgi:hypothetical protein
MNVVLLTKVAGGKALIERVSLQAPAIVVWFVWSY